MLKTSPNGKLIDEETTVANSDLTIPEIQEDLDIESSELVKQAREMERLPKKTPAEALAAAKKRLNEIVAPTGMTVSQYIRYYDEAPMFNEQFLEALGLQNQIQILKSQIK